MIRCPVEEMGRYSVIPSTSPSTTALPVLSSAAGFVSVEAGEAEAEGGCWFVSAEVVDQAKPASRSKANNIRRTLDLFPQAGGSVQIMLCQARGFLLR